MNEIELLTKILMQLSIAVTAMIIMLGGCSAVIVSVLVNIRTHLAAIRKLMEGKK